MYKMMSKVERCLKSQLLAQLLILMSSCEEERGTGCLPRLTVYTVLPCKRRFYAEARPRGRFTPRALLHEVAPRLLTGPDPIAGL